MHHLLQIQQHAQLLLTLFLLSINHFHITVEVESQLTSFLSVNKSIASEYHNKKARTLDLLAEIFSYDEEGNQVKDALMKESTVLCHVLLL